MIFYLRHSPHPASRRGHWRCAICDAVWSRRPSSAKLRALGPGGQREREIGRRVAVLQLLVHHDQVDLFKTPWRRLGALKRLRVGACTT